MSTLSTSQSLRRRGTAVVWPLRAVGRRPRPGPERPHRSAAALAGKGTINYCATIDNPPRAFFDDKQQPIGFGWNSAPRSPRAWA